MVNTVSMEYADVSYTVRKAIDYLRFIIWRIFVITMHVSGIGERIVFWMMYVSGICGLIAFHVKSESLMVPLLKYFVNG